VIDQISEELTHHMAIEARIFYPCGALFL